MNNEAKVRVRLDTAQARSELAGLTKAAELTAGRVGHGVRAALGRGASAIGLGGLVGQVHGAITGPTSSGVNDITSEAFGSIGNYLSHKLLGDMPADARAAKQAREESINAFGAIVGRTGVVTQGMRSYFEHVKSMRLDEEKGRDRLNREFGLLTDKQVESLGKAILLPPVVFWLSKLYDHLTAQAR